MRFNSKKPQTVTINFEGTRAFDEKPAMALYTIVATSLMQDTYYETADERIERIRALIPLVPPSFVMKLAIYAREKMYMRSVPIVLLCELIKCGVKGNEMNRAVTRVIHRPDDITEMLSYWNKISGNAAGKRTLSMTHAMRKGLGESFNKFDEYQLAKYYNKNAEITLRDALFLTHPHPKDKNQQKIFNKLAKKTLAIPGTWEVKMSIVGQKKFETEGDRQRAFDKEWRTVIEDSIHWDADGNCRVANYMALLRNLNNILKYVTSSEHIDRLVKGLSDKNAVLHSKQFPFRWYAAYKQIKGAVSPYTSKVIDALDIALKHSAHSIPLFKDNDTIVIAVDVSGSMNHSVSDKSNMTYYEVGMVLAALLHHRCNNVITGVFSTEWNIVNLPKSSILSNINNLEEYIGGSTNAHLVLDDMIHRRVSVDKLMFFTDIQVWDTENREYGAMTMRKHWQQYRRLFPKAELYFFDMAGYGNVPIRIDGENGTYLVAGWNTQIFAMLEALKNMGSIFEEIESMDF